MQGGKGVKKSSLLIILGGMILGMFEVSGCGGEKPLNENELLESINGMDTELSFVTFDSLEITKRQTNDGNKTDEVYCTINGQSQYADYTADCILHCNFYDQGGWILDDVEINDYKYDVISFLSEEEVGNYFDENLGSIITSPVTAYGHSDITRSSESDDKTYISYDVDFTASLTSMLSYETSGKLTLSFSFDGSCDEWSYSDNYYELNKQYIPELDGDWSIWSAEELIDKNLGWEKYIYDGQDYELVSVDEQGNEMSDRQKVEMDVLQGTLYKYDDDGEMTYCEFDWDNGGIKNYVVEGQPDVYTESYKVYLDDYDFSQRSEKSEDNSISNMYGSLDGLSRYKKNDQ